MEIPEQRPPQPEDRSRVEDVDGLVTIECDGIRTTFRQRWIYRDDWRWVPSIYGGFWCNCGSVSYFDLMPRIEQLPAVPKRSWLARLFGR